MAVSSRLSSCWYFRLEAISEWVLEILLQHHPHIHTKQQTGKCAFILETSVLRFSDMIQNCSMDAEDEEGEIDAEDIVEVIDLDEGDDEEPLDEEDGKDVAAMGPSSTHLSPAREDNSVRDWEDHGGSKCGVGLDC